MRYRYGTPIFKFNRWLARLEIIDAACNIYQDAHIFLPPSHHLPTLNSPLLRRPPKLAPQAKCTHLDSNSAQGSPSPAARQQPTPSAAKSPKGMGRPNDQPKSLSAVLKHSDRSKLISGSMILLKGTSVAEALARHAFWCHLLHSGLAYCKPEQTNQA